MRRKKKSKIPTILAALFIFVVFFMVGTGLANYFHSGTFQPALIPRRSTERVILLVGVDARNKNEPSRSDTAILVFFHPKDNRIDLLSVPRDSRVDIPGEEYKRKINYAHAKGGTDLLIETLKNVLGVKVDGYIEVDFEGFKEAIDALGGVEINVEQRMYKPSENINLHPGLQTLNGYDSLAYCRWRGDGRGDIGRIERQQKFLRALGRQAIGANGIIHSPAVISNIVSNVKTDLKISEIMAAVGQFSEHPTINSYMLPGTSQMINGASYWVIDWSETEKLMKTVKSPTSPKVDETKTSQ